MKVGLIGAGHWGRNLAANFRALGALGAVAEASSTLRDGLRTCYPEIPLFEDHRALLATDMPAIAIATPAPTHFALAREALLAGKDVFLEKPMTLSVAEAEALVELAGARGRVLMVGHLLIYQPCIRWIARYLAAGALGTIHSLHQERLNLGRARAVENVLWSFGVHDVAVLLHLVGESPRAIAGQGQRAVQPGVEDDFHLHLGFSSGIQAHLHTSWLWPERRRRLTIVGSAGMLVFDELEQAVHLHHKGIAPDLSSRDEGAERIFHDPGEPLRLELEHFLTCVAERRTPLSDGRSGVEVLRVLAEASPIRLEEPHDPLYCARIGLSR